MPCGIPPSLDEECGFDVGESIHARDQTPERLHEMCQRSP